MVYSTTPGKYLAGITLSANKQSKLSVKTLVKREIVFKFLIGFGLFISLDIYYRMHFSAISIFIDYDTLIFLISIIGLVAFVFIWILFKNTFWDFLAGTRVVPSKAPKRTLQKSYFLILLYYVVSFLAIVFLNNITQDDKLLFGVFKYPTKFRTHSLNLGAKNHVAFLAKQRQDAKEYIFNLFSKYDIVVLCERSHRETTQWDFISDVVADDRFIKQVGNIFTEYGALSKQSQVDSFLVEKFEKETDLEKGTAKQMLYMNLGFFNFMKHLNVLNNHLPDSLQIHEYFTDQDQFHEYIRTSGKPNSLQRDSLMASVVIHKFKEIQQTKNRKKCLVVTNSRHAFGEVSENGVEIKAYRNNETRYIFKAFPGKVANVLINRLAFHPLTIEYPVQFGLWDRAFAENNNKQLGFNLKGSPFGADKFDLNPWNNANLIYQDVFTGLVFVNPFDKWHFDSGYPYRLYGAEQELLTKNLKDTANGKTYQNMLANFRNDDFRDKSFWTLWYGLYNVIPYLFYILIEIVGLMVSTYLILRISYFK